MFVSPVGDLARGLLFSGTWTVAIALIPAISATSPEPRYSSVACAGAASVAVGLAHAASPVSGAMAVALGEIKQPNIGMGQILAVTIPATLVGVVVASIVATMQGVSIAAVPLDKQDRPMGASENSDAESGDEPGRKRAHVEVDASRGDHAPGSGGYRHFRIVSGLATHTIVDTPTGPVETVTSMTTLLPAALVSIAMIIIIGCRVAPTSVTKTLAFSSGFGAIVVLAGVTFAVSTLVASNTTYIVGPPKSITGVAPYLFGIIAAGISIVMSSTSAAAATYFPIGIAAALSPGTMVSSLTAVGATSVLPVSGFQTSCTELDSSGTTDTTQRKTKNFALLRGAIRNGYCFGRRYLFCCALHQLATESSRTVVVIGWQTNTAVTNRVHPRPKAHPASTSVVQCTPKKSLLRAMRSPKMMSAQPNMWPRRPSTTRMQMIPKTAHVQIPEREWPDRNELPASVKNGSAHSGRPRPDQVLKGLRDDQTSEGTCDKVARVARTPAKSSTTRTVMTIGVATLLVPQKVPDSGKRRNEWVVLRQVEEERRQRLISCDQWL